MMMMMTYSACDCDRLGSSSPVCDVITGQCPCHSNVSLASELTSSEMAADTRCSLCRFGYYGLASGRGCAPCDCHVNGSSSLQCSETDGRCPCKETVVGPQCTECRQGFFLLSSDGCT